MKKNIILSLSLMLIFINGCAQKQTNEQISEKSLILANRQYHKIINNLPFPKEIISHFPQKIASLPVEYYTDLDQSSAYSYFIVFNYNQNPDSLVALNNSLINNQLYSEYKSEINMFVIGPSDFKEKTIKEIKSGKVPIPYFKREDAVKEDTVTVDDIYSSETISGLSNDFSIYVLASGSRYHKNSDLLNDLPKAQNYGYSTGICINAKSGLIIYWTIVY